jgi:zinc/manganese transport system substrate-binding protein
MVLRIKLLLAAILWLVAAPAASAQQGAPVKAVASFSIMADLVKQVGGERVEVVSLVGPDADMHGFQPGPGEIRMLRDAKLFVINGLGFEGWADRLLKSTGFKGHPLVASRGLKALPAAAGGHGHGHGRYDPHAWQDVANVKRYVENIRDALMAVDPPGQRDYEANAVRFAGELDALERDIKSALAAIPKPQRKVITSHDAFTYFGDAYDVTFLAPQGAGNEAQPSAKRVAELIRQIKREEVRAVFVENISDRKLLDQIARETGVKVGGTLYSDALSGPSGSAPTYIAMMRHNTKAIAEALK